MTTVTTKRGHDYQVLINAPTVLHFQQILNALKVLMHRTLHSYNIDIMLISFLTVVVKKVKKM